MKVEYHAFPFTLVLIVILLLINFLTTPSEWWALYPTFFLLLGPLSLLLNKKSGYILYSLTMSGAIIAILFIINMIESPNYFWFMYAWFPILWWPLSAIAGRTAAKPFFATVAALSIIAYYTILNMYMEPGFPWAIFPTFAVLWWPLSVTYAKKHFVFSILGTILLSTFLIVLNVLTTPETPWSLYPIFAVLWWPLSIKFGPKPFAFSLIVSLLFSVFFSTINVLTSPQTVWAVYPIFAILWWPLSMYFFYYKKKAAQ